MYRSSIPQRPARRSRFSVTLANGERHVVLARSASAATDWFNRKARTLDQRAVSVVKGDYRVTELEASGGWRVNRANLAEAIEFLGITLPVRIKPTASRGGGGLGAHRFKPRVGRFMRDPARDTASGGMFHQITANSRLNPDAAGRTLWHELCHAAQAEEVVRQLPANSTLREQFLAWRTCEARAVGVAYDRKPIEVEAREFEGYNDEMPLAL